MNLTQGIYKITSPSGRIYIGHIVDIHKRWVNYKKLHAVKSQRKLYNSFKKYGTENHIFEIIELCVEEDLIKRERYYQEYFNCVEEGLNCRYVGYEEKAGLCSKETKKRMSESNARGKSYLAQKVECIETGRVWGCVKDLSEEIGMNYSTLRDKLANKVANTTPYFYVRDKDRAHEVCRQQPGKLFGGKIHRKGKECHNSKPVICIQTNKEWSNVRECSENNNIKISSLRYNLSKGDKNKTSYRYK